jgi:hypothetical protein
VLAKKIPVTCLRHEKVQYAECGGRNRGKEEESYIEAEMMNNCTGDRLTFTFSSEGQKFRS